jgi:hypothetical protein
MPDIIRTTYLVADPDYGEMNIGFFQVAPFYCSLLATGVTDPLTTDAVLLVDPPADMNGPDYVEESVEATPGNTATDYVEETFTYIQIKGFSFGGIVTIEPNIMVDLTTVDETYGGACNIDSIVAELIKYKISTGAATSYGTQTHTINQGVAGCINGSAYDHPHLIEPFVFNVGINPVITVGETADYLIQARIRANFSAYTHADATANTAARCRINCYRDLSATSRVLIPVV